MGWTDLSDSLLTAGMATFGREVIYLPAGRPTCKIRGVFDSAHESITIQEGMEFSTVRPVLGIKLKDLEAPPQPGDHLRIEASLYSVTDIQVDGQGGALLILKAL